MASTQTPPPADFTEFENPNSASVDRLVQSLDRAYHRPGLLVWRSFLSGIFYALGVTIGFTIVITISAFILQSLGGISFFQPFINRLDDMITNRLQTTAVNTQQQQIDQLLQKYSSPTPTVSPK